MSDPKSYISVSTVRGRRLWRVIHQGMPTCADRDTADQAMRLYEELTSQTAVGAPLWDGDTSEWKTIQPLHCYRVWMRDGYAGLYDAETPAGASTQAVAWATQACAGLAMSPGDRRRAITVRSIEKLS